MTLIRFVFSLHLLLRIAIVLAQNLPKDPSLHSPFSSPCKGEWKSPPDCNGYGCSYKATWEYIDESDDILFTISTRNRNKWTGIGFSANKRMPETDAILGLVEETGRFFLMDTWLKGYEIPPLDSVQNIHNMSAWRENGITNLKFYRRRLTGDKFDFQFTDNNCPYLMFPVEGGVFNAVNKRIRQHEVTPVVSETRVCIKSCRKKPPSTTSTTAKPNIITELNPEEHVSDRISKKNTVEVQTVTTTHAPTTVKASEPKGDSETDYEDINSHLSADEKLPVTISPIKVPVSETPSVPLSKAHLTFEVRMLNTLDIENLPSNSTELNTLKAQIEKSVTEELREKVIVRSVKVVDLESEEEGEETNKAIVKIGIGVELRKEDESSDEHVVPLSLRNSLKIALSDGRLGNLTVDPGYLIFINSESSNTNLVVTSETKKTSYLSEEQLKWLVIIGGVTALIVLVVVQALCMVWRDNKSKKNVVKDKQMVNSHWKDYSATTASSAYCYENFAVSEELDGALPSNKKQLKSNRHNGFSQKPNKNVDKNETGNQFYLSATMDRHNQGKQTGFGCPPSLYATHDRRDPHRTFSQTLPLQPDFYFMPHQRRYSGEVVRVFVDYNNPKQFRK